MAHGIVDNTNEKAIITMPARTGTYEGSPKCIWMTAITYY